MNIPELRNNINKILKGEQPLISIWYYIQGNYRYKVYYSKWRKFLMRKHIIQQIVFRMRVMNSECYNRGSCIKCGCMTTQLQMCDKPCEGLEYPPMLSRTEWSKFVMGGFVEWKSYIFTLGVNESKKVLVFKFNSLNGDYEKIH